MSASSDAIELDAGPDDEGKRLDRLARRLFPDAALSSIYERIRRGQIRVNGRKRAPSYRIERGDRISCPASMLPGDSNEGRASAALSSAPRDPPLDAIAPYLVLATRELLFLSKPRGMLAHGSGSLQELVLAALAERRAASLTFVPGPLHRLDRNSSGLIVFPRTALGARSFSALLRGRRLRKLYLALLGGRMARPAEWVDPIVRDGRSRSSAVAAQPDAGYFDAARGERPGAAPRGANAAEAPIKVAESRARPLLVSAEATLALVELGTGLTHQIRVQAASRGFPLIGDAKYGAPRAAGGYFLHALALDFPEPPFPDVPNRVVAPPAPESVTRLGSIFGREELEKALSAALEA